MQKNKVKKIFIIISIIIFSIIAADYTAYLCIRNGEQEALKQNNLEYLNLPTYFEGHSSKDEYSSLDFFENSPKSPGFREPNGLNYKNKSIWIFGDSFAWGADMSLQDGVPNDKTLAAKLSEYTKRPVYNRAFQSWGIQHMLYQFEKEQIFNELIEPKYVIFFHTTNNTYKLINFTYGPWSNKAYLRYKLDKKGNLYRVKPFLEPLWNFYFVKVWFNFLQYKVILTNHNFDKNFDLMKAIFIKSSNIIKKHYPNAQFIILKYDEVNEFGSEYFHSERWSELEQYGIKIIDAGQLINADLKNEEYICGDNYHPSQKALDEIAKALSRILK